MKKVLIGLLIIGVLAAGTFWFLNRSNNSSTPTSPVNTSSNDASGSLETQTVSQIIFDDNGFSSSTLTVKSGDTITITNNSNQDLDFSSDPHPTHTDNLELNIGTVEPGDSKTFAVTQKGTFGYHNHLNPSQIGTIIVQ